MRVVKGAYLADNVVVTGDVVLGAGANLWFGTVVRGDVMPIRIGKNNICAKPHACYPCFAGPSRISQSTFAWRPT